MPRVFYGVVAPWRDLVLPAVDGPGVAAASFRHLKAKRRVGNDIDPRARWPPSRADVKLELAAAAVKLPDRRFDSSNRRHGLPLLQRQSFRQPQRHRLASRCPHSFKRCDLHFNRPAVGNQHHPRHAG